MSLENRTTLKDYFEMGKKPTQQQFANLIDSALNQSQDGVYATAGGLSIGDSAPGVLNNFYVHEEGSKYAVASLNHPSSSYGSRLRFLNNGSKQASLYLDNDDNEFTVNADSSLRFCVGGNTDAHERMTINSGGMVQIGQSDVSHENDQHLLVVGDGSSQAGLKVLAGNDYGVYAKADSDEHTATAVRYGVYGIAQNHSLNVGVYGESGGGGANTGVMGRGTDSNPIGVHGFASGTDAIGVKGFATGTGAYAIYGDGDLWIEGDMYCTGTLTESASDKRLKEDIASYDNALESLMRIAPKTFRFKQSHADVQRLKLPDGDQIGFVAQDLEKVFPALVTEVRPPRGGGVDKDGKLVKPKAAKPFKSIKMSGLVPVLTAAIQEQQRTIESLEARIARLESGIAAPAKKAATKPAAQKPAAKTTGKTKK